MTLSHPIINKTIATVERGDGFFRIVFTDGSYMSVDSFLYVGGK